MPETTPANACNRFWLACSFLVAMPANATVMVLMKYAPRHLPQPLNSTQFLNATRLFLGALLMSLLYCVLPTKGGKPVLKGARNKLQFVLVALVAGVVGLALAQMFAFRSMSLHPADDPRNISAGTVLLLEAVIPGMVLVFLRTSWSHATKDALFWLLAVAAFGGTLWFEGYLQLGDFKRPRELDEAVKWLLASVALTTFGMIIKARAFPAAPEGMVFHHNLLRVLSTTFFAALGAAVYIWLSLDIDWLAALQDLPGEKWQTLIFVVAVLAVVGSCMGWLAIFHLLRHDPMLACLSLMLSPLFGWTAEWCYRNGDLIHSLASRVNWASIACAMTVILSCAWVAWRRFRRLQPEEVSGQ